MITVILSDGTEVPVSDGQVPATYTPYGEDDKLLAIYRMPEKYWVLGHLSTLKVGDCFRKLDAPNSSKDVYVVTRKPRAHMVSVSDPSRERWSFFLEGLTLDHLSNLPAPRVFQVARQSGFGYLTTTHEKLLLNPPE